MLMTLTIAPDNFSRRHHVLMITGPLAGLRTSDSPPKPRPQNPRPALPAPMTQGGAGPPVIPIGLIADLQRSVGRAGRWLALRRGRLDTACILRRGFFRPVAAQSERAAALIPLGVAAANGFWDGKADQSRLKTIDANQPVITAIMAVATPYTRP